MRNLMSKSLLLVACFLISFSSFAQFWFLGQTSKERYEAAKYVPYATLSFGAGSSTYVGELLPSSAIFPYGIFSSRWNLGVQYTKHFSRHLSYKASLSLIRIAGDDNYFNYSASDGEKLFAANYQRNLHFRNDLKEVSFTGVYDFKSQTPFRKKRPQFSPYVFLGVAALISNPIARGEPSTAKPSAWVDLRGYAGISPTNTGTENKVYSPFTFAIPFGFGFRYKLDKSTDLGFEFSYRKTFSDYLDDVSDARKDIVGPYTNLTDRSKELYSANTLRTVQAFNPSTTMPIVESSGMDSYFTTQLMLIFHIGKSAGGIN